MRRETSAGFQNGLNYIAIDVRDEPGLSPPLQQHPHVQTGDRSAWGRTRSLGGLISAVGAGSPAGVCGGPGPGALPAANAYASIDFLTHHLKEATVVKGEGPGRGGARACGVLETASLRGYRDLSARVLAQGSRFVLPLSQCPSFPRDLARALKSPLS